jgi:hypothetical protein
VKIKLADSQQYYPEVLSHGVIGKAGLLQPTRGSHNSYGLARMLHLCLHVSKIKVVLLCAVFKLMSYSSYSCLIMFCRHITSYYLEFITETVRVTKGRKYMPRGLHTARGPHVGQPWARGIEENVLDGDA